MTSLLLLAVSAFAPAAARAQSCMTLQYSFQPDCYRPDERSACAQTVDRMDLGPQIAVWLQDAAGAFVPNSTMMVTNATAVRGIGNRPGRSDFLSGPLFPYGKRIMSLPVWAHARGRTYSTVMMSEPDGTCLVGGPGYPAESCLGWHETFSSPDLYYCTPGTREQAQSDIDVDAISCPSRFFSEKGKLDPTALSYYPPRSDLTTFTSNDTPDAPTYATVNDLDAVAAATPAYGAVSYVGTWAIPSTLDQGGNLPIPPGDYTLMVEVNKEYDANAAHAHPDYVDPNLMEYGIEGNFGQPSVVYEVPIHIDVTTAARDAAAATQFAGYGDWTGTTGALNPPDGTISTGVPGSGEGRLMPISSGAGLTGRVLVTVGPCYTMVCDPVTNMCSLCDPSHQDCTPLACTPPPSPPTGVTNLSVVDGNLSATSATLRFENAESSSGPVQSYQIHYQSGEGITADQFLSAASAPQVIPGSPGSTASFTLSNLKPLTDYTVGVEAIDPCNQSSPLVTATFKTPAKAYTQLSGCFIATAAWGSALAPEVDVMRKVRDRLRSRSTMFAVAAELYYRSGPAAAEVIRRSDTARALVRRLLGPVAAASEATMLGRLAGGTSSGMVRCAHRRLFGDALLAGIGEP